MSTTCREVRVWDPIVRYGHWVLVAAFFTAYLSGDEITGLHVWAGYVVAAVVCLRLVWGFVGSRHARFSDFVRSPAAVLRYVRGLRGQRGRRYIGHNPAGGAMILALLLCVSGTAYSGLMVHAYENHAGPLAAQIATDSPAAGTRHGGDDDRDGRGASEPREEFWEELHEILANLTLALIGLHVAGGLFSSFIYRENLIKAMFTGRKQSAA